MKKPNASTLSFQKGHVLSRNQLKNITGGFAAPGDGGPGDNCQIKITSTQGATQTAQIVTSGSQGSSEANAYCVNYIASHPGSRCSYNCAYDGYVQ